MTYSDQILHGDQACREVECFTEFHYPQPRGPFTYTVVMFGSYVLNLVQQIRQYIFGMSTLYGSTSPPSQAARPPCANFLLSLLTGPETIWRIGSKYGQCVMVMIRIYGATHGDRNDTRPHPSPHRFITIPTHPRKNSYHYIHHRIYRRQSTFHKRVSLIIPEYRSRCLAFPCRWNGYRNK